MFVSFFVKIFVITIMGIALLHIFMGKSLGSLK